MRTNTISIIDLAPSYNQENIDNLLKRIHTLHPNIDEKGAEQYLLDLLNLDSMNELLSETLIYQEIEPAVNANELRILAKRILPYNDNDLQKAIYSARNILNTVPRQVSDLEDYLTEERKRDVYRELTLASFSTSLKVKNVTSLDQLKTLLKHADSMIVDLIADTVMQKIQSIPMNEQPGITARQQMLSVAAVYYVNAEVGFQCNAIWLAAFLTNDRWGCKHGWFHKDGSFCGGRHFGFKNEQDAIRLVGKSIDYVDKLLSQNDDENTVKLYIDTLISTFKIAQKQYLRYQIETPESGDIRYLLEKHTTIMSDAQRLRYQTVSLIPHFNDGVPKEHFDEVLAFISQEHEQVDNVDSPIFDYYYFIRADFEHLKTDNYVLGPSYLISDISSEKLRYVGNTILNTLMTKKLPEHVEDLFTGFYTSYLWLLINFDSTEQALFDAIFDISKAALPLFPVITRNIRFMAELGHLASMQEVLLMTNDATEASYWNKRIDITKGKL